MNDEVMFRFCLWRLGQALGFALAIAGCSNSSGPIELRLAHSGAVESLMGVTADEFARRVNERVGDRVSVTVFPNAQLGNDQVALQRLKLGTVELAFPSTVMSSAIDEFALFDMPYLVRDRAHMRRISESIVWPTLAPLAEEEGYKLLGVWENGFRHVTNDVRAIVLPEDLRGIKLRTPRSPWRVLLFETLGANPSPLPFSEVFMALQTGVMDGQENPLSHIVGARLFEVQSYLSLTGHVYSPAYLLMGTAMWTRLPADVQRVLAETGRQVEEFVIETAKQMDAEFLAELEASGIAIARPDPAPFVEASRAVYEEFASSVPGGAALIDSALVLVNR